MRWPLGRMRTLGIRRRRSEGDYRLDRRRRRLSSYIGVVARAVSHILHSRDAKHGQTSMCFRNTPFGIVKISGVGLKSVVDFLL